MRTVHKYPLAITDAQVFLVQVNAIPLHVDNQNGQLTLWMEIETTESMLSRTVYVVGTGNEVPNMATNYVGSAIVSQFVWHVYLSS